MSRKREELKSGERYRKGGGGEMSRTLCRQR